jgi:PAS domain S-box-containing protein
MRDGQNESGPANAIKIIPTIRTSRAILIASLGTFVVLIALEVLEHWLARVVSEAVAVSVTVVVVSITATVITYLTLRKQPALHQRTIDEITQREQAENARHAAEQKYVDILENVQEGIFQTTPDGRFITANPALARMFGFDSVYELTKARQDIAREHYVHPERREAFKRLLEVHGLVRNFEFEAYKKDGTTVWTSDNVRAVRDEDGAVVYYEGTVQDITERKRAQEALSRSVWIVESSGDAIIGKTLDGIITSWNSGAQKIYGYSAEEVIGSPISILVPPDRMNEGPRILEKLRGGEGLSHYETVRRRKDGTLIDVSLTVSPIRDPANKLIGASTIARDITINKKAEKILRTFSGRLIKAQEAERQHIARELHDQIGQVLTAVRMSLQSIQRSCQVPACAPHIIESIATVDEALTRVRELSLELRPSLLDDLGLTAALRWYVDRFAQRTGIVGHVDSEFEYTGRLPRDLETACFRIAQEALTNVARHSPASNIAVTLERSSKELRLTIKDDGAGFDVEELFQNGTSGAMLGIHGMEERARAVGGSFDLDSVPGKGTQVRATFPL